MDPDRDSPWGLLKRIEVTVAAQPERAVELVRYLPQLRVSAEVAHDHALLFETERVEALALELSASSIATLDLARAAYDRAALALSRLPTPSQLRARLEASEAHGEFTLRHVGVLLRLSEMSEAFADDADRAWLFFRGRRWAPLSTLPSFADDQCVLEFMSLPGDVVRVCLHWRGSLSYGRLPTTVRELSAAQKLLQDGLWASRPQRGTLAELVGQCEAIEKYLCDVQELLLERAVAWSDFSQQSLKERFGHSDLKRLTLVPHGPATPVPWAALLLRAIGRPFEVVVACPSLGGFEEPRAVVSHRSFFEAPSSTYQAVSAAAGGRESAQRLASDLEPAAVAGILGHGQFNYDDIYQSFMHLADASGTLREFSLQDLLELTDRPRVLPALVIGACEAGEISRVRKLMDYVHFPWAFLMLGCPWVLAPTWPFTSLADSMLKRLVREIDPLQFPSRACAAFGAHYVTWLRARTSGGVGDVVKKCVTAGGDLPLLDIVGWTCYGHHPTTRTFASSPKGT